jgi:hypothetical protein
MNVDDTGRRAGAALRDRYDRLAAPPLAETTPRRPRSGRTAVLAGIAAALVLALLVGFVSLGRDPGGPAEPGGTWQRISQRTAFGRNASPSLITTWRGQLLALGSYQVSKQPRRLQPAAWTSEDGERWGRVALVLSPREFWGFSTVAVRGELIVASINSNGQVWRSSDARTWRKVVDAQFHRGTTYSVQSTRDRFVATDTGPIGSGRTLWSTDGRRWTKRDGAAEGEHAAGLPVGAPLGRHRITVGVMTPTGLPPTIYRSDDGVRWNRIAGAEPPIRFGGPLAANRARTRVLGIQYERYGQYGGRLWSTRDGARWGEIASFHRQMPTANPDHLLQLGRWWVAGGNTGTPIDEHRASMWVSPDLRRWYEMPRRLRGPETQGVGMPLASDGERVIGWASSLDAATGNFVRSHLWIWTPPE